ncbi:MAG: penicillin-binding protein 2, partial [Alphaproteobacteria bacterium]
MKSGRKEAARRQARRFTRRALLLGAGQLGLFGVLVWRLHRLQVVEAPKFALLADENRINVQLLPPGRGLIFDRFGEPVADNVDTYRVLVVPDLTPDMEGSLERLSRIVPVSQAKRERVLRIARRQSPYLPIVVADNLSWRQFAQVNVLAPALPGIQTDILPLRRYHRAYAMAHIVGYVGAANKQEVNDDPVVRLPGFRIGKAGVERGFEHWLRGEAGNVKLEVDAHGRAIRRLEEIDSEQGRELVLTVDAEIQTKAMARLSEERRASVVALDVRNGEVIAMASTPSFDPNRIVFGLTADYWKELADAADDPLTFKAVRGQYPPGSTFKMVTALAGLEAGAIDTETR